MHVVCYPHLSSINSIVALIDNLLRGLAVGFLRGIYHNKPYHNQADCNDQDNKYVANVKPSCQLTEGVHCFLWK